MKKQLCLVLIIGLPSSALAQDFHKGGFFDSDVSQSGFFTEDQAGIPIKNNTGTATSKLKNDSWEVSPDKMAGIAAEQAKAASEEQQKNGSNGSQSATDSFDVKKGPTD